MKRASARFFVLGINVFLWGMEQHQNPWRFETASIPYENPWIRVTERRGLNPSGNPGLYGIVHFKNLAIGVVAMDVEQHIWLVGQYRVPLEAWSWEICEGGGPHGSDPLESAMRELQEETGLRARSWKPIVRMHLSNSVSDEACVVYLAQDLEPGEAEPEDTEQLVVNRVPFEEAYRMVRDFEITDSISVAAIQKIRLMMLEGEL